MGFTRWLLRPRDKQVLWRADLCQGLYLHSMILLGTKGCLVSCLLRVSAIEAHPYWNEFQALEKLWNEEQIGVQWEAPVIPSDPIAAAPQRPPTGPPGVWGFHLSGVGRAYSNRSLPVNIPRCSVTPLTSVLSIQGSLSYCIHFTPWQCWCSRNFHLVKIFRKQEL